MLAALRETGFAESTVIVLCGAHGWQPRDIATTTQNTDILPTLCEFCRVGPPVRAPADAKYAGTSLAGLRSGTVKGLKAWFSDGSDTDKCGAFFVTVR